MTAAGIQSEDREQQRERFNVLRVLGGLCLAVAALVFFFHLAETQLHQYTMAVIAGVFASVGALLLFAGWYKLREMK